VEALRQIGPSPAAKTEDRLRASGTTIWLSFHKPRSPDVIRPSGVTAVDSVERGRRKTPLNSGKSGEKPNGSFRAETRFIRRAQNVSNWRDPALASACGRPQFALFRLIYCYRLRAVAGEYSASEELKTC
jgi:hypothetical protein